MIQGMESRWRVSTFSFANGNCAEIASDSGTVLVRDTKDRSGPVLRFASGEWARFIQGIKKGASG